MSDFFKEIKVDTKSLVLSSESVTLKTDKFISQTKNFLSVDFFISKIAESILKNFDEMFSSGLKNNLTEDSTFKIETKSRVFSCLVKFGFQLQNLSEKSIVFYKFLDFEPDFHQNDSRLEDFLRSNPAFNFSITLTHDDCKSSDFNKLYRIMPKSGVNFPMLTKEQFQIVATEDQNVVVQGVAGSGKTNVCIDKIIWSACRNYGGRVLYTTFSRGLLADTKFRVECFKKELENFAELFETNKILFLDNNHKKAIENKLGVIFFSDDDDKILEKIRRIIKFLDTQVDYYLIEDLFKKYMGDKVFSNEYHFVHSYVTSTKNHQLVAKLQKISHISNEMIYKEIFGLIFGFANKQDSNKILSFEEYLNLRRNSFNKNECEIIYQIALDYEKYLKSNNLTDNNFATRELLNNLSLIEKYSLIVADEVQDFTQINLKFFKSISLKMFCAGDALQMINPTYFSFANLKDLLFEKDSIDVAELKNNYRNTQKIQNIINELGKINIQKFGTHSFVTNGQSVEGDVKTKAVFSVGHNFAVELSKNKYDNFTIVVSSVKEKQTLRSLLKNQEILTVAEIKGLERNTVVLYNLLSSNFDKWQQLERINLNKKTADENSVFRYYFNLFYVGVSRARQYLFVVEDKKLPSFEHLFSGQFECLEQKASIQELSKIVKKIEYTQEEYLSRIKEFVKLEQFENAKFTAQKLEDNNLKNLELKKIEIYENFVHFGKYREAGIKFWELGEIDEAKKHFTLSNDKILIELIDAISQKNQSKLNIDIINYFVDVEENEVARSFILETVKRDLNELKQSSKNLHEQFKNQRRSNNGKQR